MLPLQAHAAMSSKWFRYGFLIFFLTMFGNMVFQTYLVAAGASSLREAIKLFRSVRKLRRLCPTCNHPQSYFKIHAENY